MRQWIVVAVVVAVGLAGAVVGVVFWRGTFVVTRTADVMFADAQHGWALTTHGCGGSHRCLRIMRTVDGGHTWHALDTPPGAKPRLEGLPCSDIINTHRHCLDHLTFADTQVGYAWSDRLLYLTRDAGRTWTAGEGGALNLVATDTTVLRTEPIGAPIVVKLADRGVQDWRSLAPAFTGYTWLLATPAGNLVFVAGPSYDPNNPSRASISTDVYRSTDSGRTWRRLHPNPCGRPDEIATADLILVPDGTVVLDCYDKQLDQHGFRASFDGGDTFGPARPLPHLDHRDPYQLTAASRTVLLDLVEDSRTGETTRLYRTSDGGVTLQQLSLPPSGLREVTFRTPTFGYAITANYRGVAYTHDAGATWHTAYLP